MKFNRNYLIFPAILVGVAILMLAVNLRKAPAVNPGLNKARPVDVISLQQLPLAPEVTGFGRVRPKVEWQAIAEVSGKVIYRHPDLEKGRVLDAGTVLLKIDPLDYELRLAQAEADVSSSQAQLAKLTQEEANLKTTLKIEKNRLQISQKELARKKELRRKGLTSQSAVDLEQQNTLASKKVVQDIENQLIVLPNERKVTQAQLEVNQSRVAEARRSLDKTIITLPFDARISSVDIEQNQVVNTQQSMVIAHGIDTVEIDAQIALHDMQVLASSLTRYTAHADGRPRADQLDLTAMIQLSSGSFTQQWPAKVARISDTVNANQATVGVILEVSQDYSQLSPESAPPLVNGMFVEARLTGQSNAHWVIPERALHGNKIYLVKDDNTLDIQQITVLFRHNGKVAIRGELSASQQLITNDLLPAVAGMALRVVTHNGEPVKEAQNQEEPAS
ncbi:Membrane fusion protein of RND family multidrug efflux pump [Photobacterium marinum]|uniref:Membrane fusion protein of RND family multidrug efflux pump n=1 Tax=Photobacterium marinum TaxID=1056511 RepID=L8JAV7_9GAMM|nr:HlyD family secretion protein [Photobacterium marinum]ELR64679.1 Membrane fusion protein of RND family multidrug efflux pump [Photobacterium marinum]